MDALTTLTNNAQTYTKHPSHRKELWGLLGCSQGALLTLDMARFVITSPITPIATLLGVQEDVLAPWVNGQARGQILKWTLPATVPKLSLGLAREVPRFIRGAKNADTLLRLELMSAVSLPGMAETKWLHIQVLPTTWSPKGHLAELTILLRDYTELPMAKRTKVWCTSIEPKLARRLFPVEDHRSQQLLSERELEVLAAYARGYKRREVARLLSVTVHTVDKHRKNAINKLDVANVKEALRTGYRQGLFH